MPSLPTELTDRLPGRFIVFDGPDGSGKSTQLARFVGIAEEAGLPVTAVREPGGTEIGERIREILLAARETPADPRCEMLLFMASRAELVRRVVRPALEARRLVVADRYVSSTLAYQGTAGGLPEADIREAFDLATGSLHPDLYLIFDVDLKTALRRTRGGASGLDQMGLFEDGMEARDRAFREAVRAGYLRQAEADPARYVVIDASRGEDEVAERVLAALAERLAGGAA